MSLKELTADLHDQAENTAFMKAVFAKSLPKDTWINWTYQKTLIYNIIEDAAGRYGVLDDIDSIRRSKRLYDDYMGMTDNKVCHFYLEPTLDYYKYLTTIVNDTRRMIAHLYVWHMGDLFGGQMIKKITPGPHTSLEFDNVVELKTLIRNKLHDDMAQEARIAFQWAIKIMDKLYDDMG